MPFFCARLHVVCIVDNDKHAGAPPKYTCDYQFILFAAENDEDAFQTALARGRQQETSYKNSDNENVRWVLRAVEEILRLPDNLDGIEVGSILDVYEPERPLDIAAVFEPEKHIPQFNNVNAADDLDQSGNAG